MGSVELLTVRVSHGADYVHLPGLQGWTPSNRICRIGTEVYLNGMEIGTLKFGAWSIDKRSTFRDAIEDCDNGFCRGSCVLRSELVSTTPLPNTMGSYYYSGETMSDKPMIVHYHPTIIRCGKITTGGNSGFFSFGTLEVAYTGLVRVSGTDIWSSEASCSAGATDELCGWFSKELPSSELVHPTVEEEPRSSLDDMISNKTVIWRNVYEFPTTFGLGGPPAGNKTEVIGEGMNPGPAFGIFAGIMYGSITISGIVIFFTVYIQKKLPLTKEDISAPIVGDATLRRNVGFHNEIELREIPNDQTLNSEVSSILFDRSAA